MCGLLRCIHPVSHAGLHQAYNAATGESQSWDGLFPVEPTPEPPQERKAYYAKVLEDEAGFVRYDAVSRAGENRVHLYGWRLNGTQVGLGYIRRRPDNTIELTEERAPTVEPAPCVWRKSPETGLWKTTCDVPAIFNAPSSRWKFCGFCGHPLTVER